jgi:hypothetical protein
MLRWILLISILLIIDFYAFQGIKTLVKSKIGLWFYWVFSVFVVINLIFQLNAHDRSAGMSQGLMFSFAFIILSTVPKLISIIVLLGEDLVRLTQTIINYFQSSQVAMPERRAFVSKIALSLAAIPFGAIIYGVIKGKYNYKVIQHTLFFDDLPKAFEDFKLTHISDVHSGSFDNAEKIKYGIDLINQQVLNQQR